MSIESRLNELKRTLPENVKLIAVSKFYPAEIVRETYDAGHRRFGESRVQELTQKYDQLPKDIEWHFIGHLQTNKVKYIAPFISLIQSVDSVKLLKEIDFQASLFNRNIPVLLQVHIAKEAHKFGFSAEEIDDFLKNEFRPENFQHITISGLMGMATFTDETTIIESEFASLSRIFTQLKSTCFAGESSFRELSMGMSDDYPIAVANGSTMLRIGSKIFGNRK